MCLFDQVFRNCVKVCELDEHFWKQARFIDKLRKS